MRHIMKYHLTGGYAVRLQQNKRQLLLFYLAGFLVGILYANLISKDHTAVTGIFNEYFLNEYLRTKIVPEDYLWYLVRIRLIPFACMCVLGLTRFKRGVVIAVLIWTGFLGGIVIVTGFLRMGVFGLVLCFAGLLPHFIFYILAYAVVLWYFYTSKTSRWNTSKTVFTVVVFCMGMIMEGYVNPILMKMVIRFL